MKLPDGAKISDVEFEVEDEKVAKIFNTTKDFSYGVVAINPVGVGETTIVAKLQKPALYEAKCKVKVLNPITISYEESDTKFIIKIQNKDDSIGIPEESHYLQIKTVDLKNGKESNWIELGKVSEECKYELENNSDYQVTARWVTRNMSEDGYKLTNVQNSCTILSKKQDESGDFPITIGASIHIYANNYDEESYTINSGDSLKLNVQLTEISLDKKVTWKSSNEKVATIDQNGVVTAKSEGTTIIEGAVEEGVKYTDTFTIEVKSNTKEEVNNDSQKEIDKSGDSENKDKKVEKDNSKNKDSKAENKSNSSDSEEKELFWKNASPWATEDLTKAEDKGLIPDIFENQDLTKNITRKEFAYVAVKLYEKISGIKTISFDNNPFSDIKDKEVIKAYNIGITQGTSKTTFSPNDLITREQMATMLTRALNKAGVNTSLENKSINKFSDDSEIGKWYTDSVYFMASNDIIKGVGNNKFSPKGNATREEALSISVRSTEKF